MLNLSYFLNPQTPAYGNGEGPVFEPDKQMCCGDSCNTLKISMSNHHGTHLDAPLHFDPDGKSLSDYPADFWYCKNVILLDCPLDEGEILTPEKLGECLSRLDNLEKDNVDALILKTGWSKRRGSEEYMLKPPGFHSDLADYLRSEFGQLKFFGFDVISLSSFTNRPMGRIAHKTFLAQKPEILILEDLNLNSVESMAFDGIENLLIAPLMIEKGDGAPCTVFANL